MGATEVATSDRKQAVNLNRKVEVKLTDRGLEVLNNYYISEYPRLYRDPKERRRMIQRHPRGEDGAFRFQFYELMAIFGPSLPDTATSSLAYHLFEGNDIVFIDD